jgi:hypothetical protein
MRVSITSSGLEVTAHLHNTKEVDKLIQILEINKAALEPIFGVFTTNENEPDGIDEGEEQEE